MAEDKKWYMNTIYSRGTSSYIPRPKLSTDDNDQIRSNLRQEQAPAHQNKPVRQSNEYTEFPPHSERQQEINSPAQLRQQEPIEPLAPARENVVRYAYENVEVEPDYDRKGSVQAETISTVTRSSKANHEDLQAMERSVTCLKITLGVLCVLIVALLAGIGAYVYFSITEVRELQDKLQISTQRIDDVTQQVETVQERANVSSQRLEDVSTQLDSVQEKVNVSNPCYSNPCTNGLCQTQGDGDVICKCDQGWAGTLCDRELLINTTGTTITLNWDTGMPFIQEEDMKYTWFIQYREYNTIQDDIHIYTYDNYTTVEPIQRLSYYKIKVYSIDFKQVYVLRKEEFRFVQRHESSLDLEWEKSGGDDNGYHVVLSRLNRPKSGRIEVQLGQANITDLDPCVSYRLEILRVDPEYQLEYTTQIQIVETECAEIGWLTGKSIIVSEWSGGGRQLLVNYHCQQPDTFNMSIINPTCNNEQNVGEAVVDTESHSGSQSWHYKRGYYASDHGTGRPYAPQLKYKAGRNDGNYTGETDGFYASLWFKMTEIGDDSEFEIAGGSPEGSDRISVLIYIKSTAKGLNVSTFEASDYNGTCTENRNCTSQFINVPLGIHLNNSWHRLEFELRSFPGDYQDQWTYWVDGDKIHSGGSYLSAYMLENDGFEYRYVNRIMIKARNPWFGGARDIKYKGAYFDDIYYETFDWTNRYVIFDSYFTSFELD